MDNYDIDPAVGATFLIFTIIVFILLIMFRGVITAIIGVFILCIIFEIWIKILKYLTKKEIEKENKFWRN